MSFAYGVNVMREPPVRPCRYTCGESPTESNVRPSGEIEATITHQLQPSSHTRQEGNTDNGSQRHPISKFRPH